MSKKNRASQGDYLARQARENRSLVEALETLVRENEVLATRAPAIPTHRRGPQVSSFILYFTGAAMLTIVAAAGVVMGLTGPPSAQQLREGVSNLSHIAKTAVDSF
jgi:hypothetical protein